METDRYCPLIDPNVAVDSQIGVPSDDDPRKKYLEEEENDVLPPLPESILSKGEIIEYSNKTNIDLSEKAPVIGVVIEGEVRQYIINEESNRKLRNRFLIGYYNRENPYFGLDTLGIEDKSLDLALFSNQELLVKRGTKIVYVRWEDFFKLVISNYNRHNYGGEYSKLCLHLLEQSVSRRKEIENWVEIVSFCNLDEMIAYILLDLLKKNEKNGCDDGKIGITHQELADPIITLRITQQELADRLGTYRETVTSKIGEFKASGIIPETGYGWIEVNKDNLIEFLGEEKYEFLEYLLS